MAQTQFIVKNAVDKKLAKLFGKILLEKQVEYVQAGLNAGSEIVAKAARQLVPVGTGLLQSTIKPSKKKPRRKKSGQFPTKFVAPIRVGTRRKLKIPADSPGFYPAAIEYGFTHTSGKKIPARPFMRPALDNNDFRVRQVFSNEVKKGIFREMARGLR